MKTIKLTETERKVIERKRKATLDKRIYQRLSAVLQIAAGKSRAEVCNNLGVSLSQLGDWLRIFRNRGLDVLCRLHYKGDPGFLSAMQITQLKDKVHTGCFRNSDQIRDWLFETFAVSYKPSGIKDLLKRIGVTYHKVTGFLWKGDPEKQHAFVAKVESDKRQATNKTRRYYLDACHPIWGLDLVYSCWLLRGQEFLVGMGSGRKRLNILGAYCPDDHEYIDMRLPAGTIKAPIFIQFLEKLKAAHPETEKFILYADGAKYFWNQEVEAWRAKHPEFILEKIPAYSPNVNLIERLWKFMKKHALQKWHKTFEAMQEAIAQVLDNLGNYAEELRTLMTEKFHIIDKKDIPVEYTGVV